VDFQDQFVGVSFPPLKFAILAIFVSFSHFNNFDENFWSLQGRLIELRETFGFFFSEFFFHTLLQERGFLLEKRGFATTFEVIKHATLGLLGHGIQY